MKVLFLESLPYRSDFRVGSHQYAERFAADGASVFWLSHPISPLHFLHPARRDLDERLRGWRKGPIHYGNVTYYSPLTLLPATNAPVLRSRWVTRSSSALCSPSILRTLVDGGFDKPDVIWLTNPVFQPLAERLRTGCRAIRVADDHTQFRNVPDAIRELEEAAIDSADVVFAVATSIYERLSARCDGVVHLPNGADYQLFSTPQSVPADLADIPRPRVVYVGALEYWFDAGLLGECMRALPDASFVVIGPRAEGQLESVKDSPNLHSLGPRPHSELPGYLQHSDMGIVPFARDALVDSIHPIKVYEYLAAGLPVVATRWTELEEMRAPVFLADRAEFPDALATALGDPGSTVGQRQAYAAANSWDTRYAVVKSHVEAVLGGA